MSDPVSGRADLRGAFLKHQGWEAANVTALPGDASFRRYFRLCDGGRLAMLMDAPPPRENVRPFLTVAGLLHRLGYSAPRIFAADAEAGFLLLEDLGDATYTRLIAVGADETALYALATDLLVDLHGRFELKDGHALPAYSDAKLLDEAALLTDWFLPEATGAATPSAARDSYLAAWQSVLPAIRHVPASLVLRDYHIDNLMRLDGRPGLEACGLLDFQDAVIGPVAYDFVSLVEDARRDVGTGLAAAMRERYLAARPELDAAAFDAAAAVLAAQRHAKVIGIFCRLARRDDKPVYLGHLPRLWRLIERHLADPVLAPVAAWFAAHVPAELRGIPARLAAPQLAAAS